MTYVREQSSTELAVHMRSLQKMPGWHDPLADRLWQEVEALKAEVAGLRTGYEAYEQVNAELKAEVEGLRKSLLDAAEEIDAWGSYASDYFQEKHDLAGCVAKFHAAAMGKGEQS